MTLPAWLGHSRKFCPQESLCLHSCTLLSSLLAPLLGILFPCGAKMASNSPSLHSVSLETLWEREHPFWVYILFQQMWEKFSLVDFRSHANPWTQSLWPQWFSVLVGQAWVTWPFLAAGFHQPLRKLESFSLAPLRPHGHPGSNPCDQGDSSVLIGHAWVVWPPLVL